MIDELMYTSQAFGGVANVFLHFDFVRWLDGLIRISSLKFALQLFPNYVAFLILLAGIHQQLNWNRFDIRINSSSLGIQMFLFEGTKSFLMIQLVE